MRGKTKSEYCKKTRKYCYSSEAKANRAKNKYDEIKRVYFCKECEKFHTTKIDLDSAIRDGIIEPEEINNVSPEIIELRIKKLQEKIKQQLQ